jgi:hypothetical protein
MLRLKATHLIKRMNSGRTAPSLCGCADMAGKSAGEFVVKYLESASALKELVGSRLASHFGILVPEPAVVEITQEFGELLPQSEPRLPSANGNTAGLAFGTRFMYPITVWPVGKSIPGSMLADAAQIFAFDALIQNPDRRAENPNIFMYGDSLLILDHELAFSFLLAIGGNLAPWNLERQDYLRRHVFYSRLKAKELDLSEFEVRLKKLTEAKMRSIKKDIPEDWLDTSFDSIAEHIDRVRAHAKEFLEQVRRSTL